MISATGTGACDDDGFDLTSDMLNLNTKEGMSKIKIHRRLHDNEDSLAELKRAHASSVRFAYNFFYIF